MSVKQKLHIAQELLKQTSYLLTEETRKETKENFKRLSESLKTLDLQDDKDFESEKMAFSILNNVIQVCVNKMKDYYGIYEDRLKETELLNEITQKTFTQKDFAQKLAKILKEDANKEMISKMNINTFMNILQVEIQDSSEESNQE